MLVSHSKPDTLDNSVLISFLQSQYPTQFPPSESVAGLTLLASVSPNAKLSSSRHFKRICGANRTASCRTFRRFKHTDLKVGGVVPTKDGLLTANLTYPSTGAVHVTHVLEFVEGRMWADIKRQSNPQLLASLGDALAQFDAAFKNVDLKSHSVALKRELKWDLMHAAWIGDNFRALEFVAGALDCAKIDLVRSALDQFNTTTLPALRALPHQLIYNDANDNNIVVAKGAHKVASFIGFGDICVAPQSATWLYEQGKPLRIAVHIIQGYVARQPLPESSIPLLYNLVQMRLAVSVTVSAINRLENPNDAYLTISEKPAWELLAKWNKIHPSLAHATFREAAGLSAVPSAVRVTKWIQSAKPHPILSVAPSTKFVTLDLSMGSTLFAEPKDWTDISRFNKIVADTLDQAGGSNVVGVGRYSEPRCIYYGDAYKRQTEEGPEWRTVHLGIDLFVAAGHKVFAPFDATIFSVTDNDNPLDYGPTVILESQTSEGDKFWTLYGHLDPEVLTRLTVGSTIKAGDLVAHIGAEDRNGGWPPHLHFQVIADSLDARERGDFPGVAFPAEIAVWSALSPDPTSFAGLSGLSTDITVFPDYLAEARELLQIRREKVGYNLSISYDVPLHIVRGFLIPVVKAAHLQNNLLNTNTRYLHPNMIRLSQKLTATLPAPLSVCYFVNSGSEANELAIHPFRGMYRGAETAIKTLKDRGEPMGMFIAESILGCGGQIVLPDGYLKKIYEVVRAEGGVCVADEVQVGFARVGSHFWGFETQGVVPDIVTMGKPFGRFNNGMEYLTRLAETRILAIGLATLQVIHDENLQENAFKVGNHLLAGLERVKNAFPKYGGDARGLGSIWPDHNVLKIKPPICFSMDDADLFPELEDVF
ncbi:PLP-dependent transferase [Rhizoclosmatium globosum]|uniref:PLP-dependent transferase n=1 Tax=Rhizoclosmatium globosum TaxID=329046 RepID=A0A1Y2D028_9FUNG|nr:PLP-dependent transferase [Rhizoclosmatium globosum]|eukprot:ORY52631.1 PLP-dependent transferase [Rhizoclosmatium globosum]